LQQRNQKTIQNNKHTSSPQELVLSLKGLKPATGLRNNKNTNHPHEILNKILTSLFSSSNLWKSTSTMSTPKHTIPHRNYNLNSPLPSCGSWSQGIKKKNPKPITGNRLWKPKGCFKRSQSNESLAGSQQRVTLVRGWFR